jgi:peptidoglycan/xylan/chitin deacetylase (PgdA/CDA1 family)
MVMSPSSGLPILCYHSLDRSGSPVSVAPRSFADQMAYLRGQGYQAVTLHEVVEFAQKGHTSVKRPVCIVFDDGYQNNYTEAFPVLQKVGFPATIFVTTDYCGKSNGWGQQNRTIPTLPMMSWSEIMEMSRHGIEFGSHTKSHPKLAELDAKIAHEELEGAKKALEHHLGKKVEYASYPFGSFNDEVKVIAQSLFKAVVSTQLGKVRQGSHVHALERINAASDLFKRLPISLALAGSFNYYLAMKHGIDWGKRIVRQENVGV